MVTSDFRPEVDIAVSCMRHASGHYRNSSLLWTWLGADTTFHRTYSSFQIFLSVNVCF